MSYIPIELILNKPVQRSSYSQLEELFSKGEMKLEVVESKGEGRYVVTSNGQSFEILSDREFKPGQKINVSVSSKGETITLNLERIETPAKAFELPTVQTAELVQVAEEAMLKDMGLEPNQRNVQIIKSLLNFQVPITKENFETVSQSVQITGGDIEKNSQVSAFLLSKGINPTPLLTTIFSDMIYSGKGEIHIEEVLSALDELSSDLPEHQAALEETKELIKSISLEMEKVEPAELKTQVSSDKLENVEKAVQNIEDITKEVLKDSAKLLNLDQAIKDSFELSEGKVERDVKPYNFSEALTKISTFFKKPVESVEKEATQVLNLVSKETLNNLKYHFSQQEIEELKRLSLTQTIDEFEKIQDLLKETVAKRMPERFFLQFMKEIDLEKILNLMSPKAGEKLINNLQNLLKILSRFMGETQKEGAIFLDHDEAFNKIFSVLIKSSGTEFENTVKDVLSNVDPQDLKKFHFFFQRELESAVKEMIFQDLKDESTAFREGSVIKNIISAIQDTDKANELLRVLDEAIRENIKNSPVLHKLDTVIKLIDSLLKQPETEESKVLTFQKAAVIISELIEKPHDEATRMQLREILFKLDSNTLNAIKEHLQGLEEDEIRMNATLRGLSDIARGVRSLTNRTAALNLLSVASQSEEGGGMYYVEVPLLLGEELGVARLKVFCRGKQKQQQGKKKGEIDRTRIALSLRTTNLGEVIGDIEVGKKDLKVRFVVQTKEVRNLFNRFKEDLIERIEKIGYKTNLTVQISKRGLSEENILFEDLSQAFGRPGSVDVRA